LFNISQNAHTPSSSFVRCDDIDTTSHGTLNTSFILLYPWLVHFDAASSLTTIDLDFCHGNLETN